MIWNLHVHLVFVTKYRAHVFTDPMLTRTQQIMADVCTDFGAELREFNGERDHVHLLVHYPPTVQPSRLVNSLKGVSSRHLRTEFEPQVNKYLWGGRLWAPSYFAASAGGAPLSIIADYIRGQARPTT